MSGTALSARTPAAAFPVIAGPRRAISECYDALLLPHGVRRPALAPGTAYNYAYYAVVLRSEAQVLAVCEALTAQDIFPRRYFYPALTELPYVNSALLPRVADLARRVLCLPLYHDLPLAEVERIAHLVIKQL